MTPSTNRLAGIPELEECFRLMEQYEMLPNIRNHSLMVAGVSELIIDHLLADDRIGEPAALPRKEVVVAGALLHDIAKTPCLKNRCDHAAMGAEILEKHGYPELARIVAEHVVLASHDPERYARGLFNARDIVYYADKRVLHEGVVSLDRRLEYILEVYGRGSGRIQGLIRENFAQCLQLERHLFNFMPFSPESLGDKLTGRVSTVKKS